MLLQFPRCQEEYWDRVSVSMITPDGDWKPSRLLLSAFMLRLWCSIWLQVGTQEKLIEHFWIQGPGDIMEGRAVRI